MRGQAIVSGMLRRATEYRPQDGLTLGQIARIEALRARRVTISRVEGVWRAEIPLDGDPRYDEWIVARHDLGDLLRLARETLGDPPAADSG